MKPLNVLSLFDGMACGLVALKRAGIPVENYYASEIDKYAVQIAMKNHPEIQQLGDVKGWKEWNLPRIDLVMGGSPCQGFSVAGKGLNFDDPRSRLFFDFVDIRNHYGKINPDLKFLLENVRMKKEWRDVITEYMGVEPVEINSALVSAQNRKRLYWANWNIEQPEDRGLVLADILEDGDVDRDRLPDVRGAAIRNQVTKRGVEEQLNIRKDDKSNCVVPSYPHKLNGIVRVGTASDIKGHDSVKRIYSSEGDLPSLTTMQGGHRQPKVAIDFYLTEEQVKKVKFQKGAKQIKRKKGEFEYFCPLPGHRRLGMEGKIICRHKEAKRHPLS